MKLFKKDLNNSEIGRRLKVSEHQGQRSAGSYRQLGFLGIILSLRVASSSEQASPGDAPFPNNMGLITPSDDDV